MEGAVAEGGDDGEKMASPPPAATTPIISAAPEQRIPAARWMLAVLMTWSKMEQEVLKGVTLI